jgi:hypothetical protein
MSRFVTTTSPGALPGQCRTCGSAVKLPMVDLGYSEDYYGAVYLCIECVTEIANEFGYISPKTFENNIRYTQELETKILDLEHSETLNKALLNLITEAGYVKANPDISISVTDTGVTTTSVFDISTEDAEFSENTGTLNRIAENAILVNSTVVESSPSKNVGAVLPSSSIRDSNKSRARPVI